MAAASQKQIPFTSCPHALSKALSHDAAPYKSLQLKRKTDLQVLHEMHEWMARKLPCIAGRREYNRGRYMLRVAGEDKVQDIFQAYKGQLVKGKVLACLLVFNDARFYANHASTGQVFRYLADQMACIGKLSAKALANGAALTNSIQLRCPVTNQLSLFDDFECIAFCPQSNDGADPLYDPLLFAPYPCVNLSSDVYAFSNFVSDSAQAAWGKPVYEETSLERIEKLFAICVERWQRVAITTIGNYEAVTDRSRCPVHITKDKKYWIAFHKDPAFAEQIKQTHQHELPVLYAKRITARWLKYFKGEKDYVATGLARDGAPVQTKPCQAA